MSVTVAIIAGIIAAAGTITSSAMANKAQKEAKNESKDLAMIARGDELDQKFKDYKLNLEGVQLNKESMALKNRELNSTLKLNKSIAQKQAISTLGTALNNSATKDQNMTNFIMSLYGKTGVKQ